MAKRPKSTDVDAATAPAPEKPKAEKPKAPKKPREGECLVECVWPNVHTTQGKLKAGETATLPADEATALENAGSVVVSNG